MYGEVIGRSEVRAQFISLRNGATDNYVQYDLEHLHVKSGGHDMSAALTTKAMGMT